MIRRFQIFSQNGLLSTMEDTNPFEVNLPAVLRFAQNENPEEIIDFIAIQISLDHGDSWIEVVSLYDLAGKVAF